MPSICIIVTEKCSLSYLGIYTSTCLVSEKSWVRIPPEVAHFSLKKGRWVVSDVVVLFVICIA